MRKSPLVALIGGLLIPVVMAQAAGLNVNAGVLQTWAFDVDLQPPPTVNVSIELAEYKGNSGHSAEKRDSRVIDYALLEGHSYFVSYDNQIRDCPSTVPPPSSQTSVSFTASPEVTYVLCVQQAQQGTVTVRAGAADGPVVEPSTPSTAVSNSLMLPEESPSPAVDEQGAARAPDPAEPQESPAPVPEPAPVQTEEQVTPTEPQAPVDEEAVEPTTQTSPVVPEETAPAPTRQPCAWEVQEDDDSRTHLVEVCPDDATEGAEGDGAP